MCGIVSVCFHAYYVQSGIMLLALQVQNILKSDVSFKISSSEVNAIVRFLECVRVHSSTILPLLFKEQCL